jgi:hypothetical protein
MNGFSLQQFKKRTAELVGHPELADTSRMRMIEAEGSICGVKQIFSYFTNLQGSVK